MLAVSGTVFAAAPEISATDLKVKMDSSNIVVVYPLSIIEFNDLHIEGSINIPMGKLKTDLPADKSTPLAFYCLGRKWTASVKAASVAVEMGFTEVYAFRDGLPGWIKKGYPTTTIEKIPKVKVAKVKATELKQMIDSGADIVIVDIRPKYELIKGSIDTAKINADLSQISTIVDSLPRDKQIVIVDLNGKRGGVAYRYLAMKGLTDLILLDGGMQKWMKSGLPIK